jgi:outer membrane protein assembly factor BamB
LKARRSIVGVLFILLVLLAACGKASSESWAGISASDSTIYVSYNKRVVALSSASGAILWEYPNKKDRDAQFFAVPVVTDDTIYVGDYKGRLHAISRDGQLKWVYKPAKEKVLGLISVTPRDRVISGVAVDSDKVYFGLGSRNVVALSRQDGTKVWSFDTGHGVWATPLYIPASDSNSQAVLYVVSLDHYLYALNPETGKELWRKNLGGAAPGNMVYDAKRDVLYIGTFESELLAIDLKTRTISDRYSTEGWIWGSPAFVSDEDMLYVGDLAGYVYAVRITDQGFEQVWKQSVSKSGIRATPLVTNDLVVVGTKGKYVYAIARADGSEKWKMQTKGQVLSEMVLAPGDTEGSSSLIIVGTSDRGQLVLALKADSGDVGWHYSDK